MHISIPRHLAKIVDGLIRKYQILIKNKLEACKIICTNNQVTWAAKLNLKLYSLVRRSTVCQTMTFCLMFEIVFRNAKIRNIKGDFGVFFRQGPAAVVDTFERWSDRAGFQDRTNNLWISSLTPDRKRSLILSIIFKSRSRLKKFAKTCQVAGL